MISLFKKPFLEEAIAFQLHRISIPDSTALGSARAIATYQMEHHFFKRPAIFFSRPEAQAIQHHRL